MDKREPIVFCWSGGKDSALALHRLLADERYRVVSLLTTVNERFARVSMHGVRLELAQAQAREIGLPLDIVPVSSGTNEEYEQTMAAHLLAYRKQGVSIVAFGDIFLEDLRRWREERLAQIGMSGLFPLWKLDTRKVIGEFIDLGFASIVCCVSDAYLDETTLGRTVDWGFIDSLPADVDPCGENGEFHTFACAGPIFKNRIAVDVGEIVYQPAVILSPSKDGSAPTSSTRSAKGFWFCDLVPRPGG
ncbi:MAG TPA: diphthine--ammonia ligase [Candidatus Cybelea sp.]